MRKLDAQDEEILERMMAMSRGDETAGIMASFAHYTAALMLVEGRDAEPTGASTPAMLSAYKEALEEMRAWAPAEVERTLVLHTHYLTRMGVKLGRNGRSN